MKVQRLIDLFCPNHKFLVFNLVRRNLMLKYRKSVLGFLWSMLAPASTALVYFIIFKFVMKVAIPNYLAFILMGVLPWGFFLTAIGGGLESLVLNHSLLNKIPLPIHSLPYSECLTAFLNFLFSVPILLVVILLTGAPITWNLLLIPYFFVLLFLQCYAYALILGLGFVHFRDLKHGIAILTQLLFYLTPILYKIEMVPENLRWMIYMNPLSMIFSSLHVIAVDGTTPDSFHLLHSLLFTIAVFLVGYRSLRSQQNTIIEFL